MKKVKFTFEKIEEIFEYDERIDDSTIEMDFNEWVESKMPAFNCAWEVLE